MSTDAEKTVQCIEETLLAYCRQQGLFKSGDRVIAAYSGGADSMALLLFLLRRRKDLAIEVLATHVNHGIRGASARADANFVTAFCRRNGVELFLYDAEKEGVPIPPQPSEEWARELRYTWFDQLAAREEALIATAHTCSDQAETLLFRMARGTGLHGLAGIPPCRGIYRRPCLCLTRADTEAYCAALGQNYVQDETNAADLYARNRIRRQVVPVLRQLNPRLTESAAETMGYLRTDNDYLNAQAAAACQNARWAEDDLVIEARYIAQLPAAIAPRAVRRLLEMMGDGSTNCSAAHLKAVVELARGDDPSAVVFLPGGRLAQRVYRELLLTTQSDPLPPFLPTPLALDGETEVEGTPWRVRCRPVRCPDESERKPGALYLAQGALEGPLVLRPRQTGDAVTLPGRGGTKTLKKLFIDEKVPRRERERIPVLADGRGVAAVAGFGPEQSRTAVPGQAAYELLFWKKE